MKLYTFAYQNEERLGVEAADGQMIDVLAASQAAGGPGQETLGSMLALIDAGEAGLAAVREIAAAPPANAVLPMEAIKILIPLKPRKISSCSSFHQHLRQSVIGTVRMMTKDAPDPEAAYQQTVLALGLDDVPKKDWFELPGYYFPDITTLCSTDQEVKCPAYSNWMDYELELTAITGRGGKDIPRDQADSHIFGYSILNDLSARDMQLKAMRTDAGPGKGKNFDFSNPFGPCIVTVDEIPDPFDLDAVIRVNGEVWSETSTRDPHWRFGDFIAHTSMAQTMMAGEMFSAGTIPFGCAIELERKVGPGDVIELTVDKIGTLRTFLT